MFERRERATARYRETLNAANAALGLHYGASARLALRKALIIARNAFGTASDDLTELEQALDGIDERIHACVKEDARMSEKAVAYAPLGLPSSDAELVSHLTTSFRDPPQWAPAVAEVLRGSVHRFASQIRGEVFVVGQAQSITLSFHERDLPFRLELDAKESGEPGTYYFDGATLFGRVRRTLSSITVRPQSFGDDLLSALRIRWDFRFDDDQFDPLYFVAGDEEALRDFFTSEVRAAFVRIAKNGPVSVEIGKNEVAIMRLEAQKLRDACAFLAALL